MHMDTLQISFPLFRIKAEKNWNCIWSQPSSTKYNVFRLSTVCGNLGVWGILPSHVKPRRPGGTITKHLDELHQVLTPSLGYHNVHLD